MGIGASRPTTMITLALVLAVGIGISGCGRKGAPLAPPDKDPGYARVYPVTPTPPAYVAPKAEATQPANAPATPPPNKGGLYDYMPNWK